MVSVTVIVIIITTVILCPTLRKLSGLFRIKTEKERPEGLQVKKKGNCLSALHSDA